MGNRIDCSKSSQLKPSILRKMTGLVFNKSIVQMGTGKVGGGGSSSLSSYLATPDILTEVNHFQVDFFISRNVIPIYKIL